MQKIKKPISILLAVLMVVSLFTVVPFTASAAEAFSGEGTADNPYLITSAEDWNTLASSVNNSSSAESYSGKYFKLTDDISVSTMIGVNNHAGSPAQTNLKSFCGIFDGDGHTVNVNINSTATHGAAPFSATKNATIKNLTVTGTVNGGIHSSGLVGVPNGTLTVENVTVSVAVTADRYLGGFVGHNFDATTVIKSSIFNGSLTNSSTTKQYIGGFIGWGGLDISHPANITLDGCLFDGTYSKDKTNNFNPVGYCVDTYCGVTLNNFYTTVDSYGSASGIRVVSGSAQEIQTSVAQVMTSSTSAFYGDFSTAITNWTDGSTLKLLADVTMNSTITVSGTRTLDLNGYGITKSGQGRMFNVNGNLTINDSNPTRSTHHYSVDGTGLASLDENGTQSFQGGYLTGGYGYTQSGEYGWGGFAIVDINHSNNNYSLTINGGTIIGNKTDIGGGGVVRFNSNSTFTMNGGAIIYNTTANNDPNSLNNDGAVSGESNVKFYIRGGTIAHNTTRDGVTSDLYLANNQKVIVDRELNSDTSIGIKMQSGTGVFTDSTDTSYSDASKFFSDNSAYGVLKNADGQLELKNVYTVTWNNWDGTELEKDEKVFKDTTPTFDGETPTKDEDDIYTYTFSGWNPAVAAVTGDTTYTAQFTATPKPHEHDGVAFQPWTSTNSLPATAGNYYLTSDVTISATWNIPTGTTNLCLNGHSITAGNNKTAIRMDAGRNLNLYDCGTQTRYYIIDSSTHRGSIVDEAAYNAFEGTKGTFTGGYITANNRCFDSPTTENLNSTVNMYGGTVFGCSSTVGSAVYSFGKFNIYGGAFIGNCSSHHENWSGTVYNAGQLKMSGGLIRHNYAANGAGIFQEIWKSSSLTITGGQIIDNTATRQGGGVFSNDQGSNNAKIYISGNPVITGNKLGTADNNFFIPQNRGRLIINNTLTDGANIGITMQSTTGVFTDSTDTSLNVASKFFSDDSSYNVRKNASGQLEIGSGYTVTWKNWDGTVLETDENVLAGTTPTYNGATPTRPSDSTNNYYFTGWEPTVNAITGDTTYTATYRAQKQLVIKKGDYIRMGAYKDYYVDWFCALQNGTGFMMLSKYALRDMVFGSNSTYKTSNVHNWLDTKSNGVCDFATDLGLSQAEMNLARALNLSYGDGSEKFIIPSFEELKGTTYTKAKVIYDQNTTAFAYWLRTYRTSGGKKDNNNERVVRSQYSKVDERYRGVIYDAYVRPMFYLDTEKIKTMPYTGSGTESDPYVFETRQKVAKNVTILGSGATGGGDVTATATRSDITQRTDQKLYISTLPNKLPTNSEVTVTAKPSAGYEFVSMEVLDADNHRLAYTEDPENPTATFTLSGNVKVNAKFKKVNTITFYSDIEGTKVWKTVKRTAYMPLTDITPSFNETTGKWTGEYQLSDQNNELFTFGGWATKSGITVWKDDKAGTTAPPEAFDWTQNMPDNDVELYPVWVANYINVRLDLGAYDAVAVADVAAGRNNWYDASRYDANTPASMGSPTSGDDNYQSRSFWKSTNITASTPDKDKYIDMDIMNAAQRAGYTLDGWYNSSGMKWEPNYLISREYGDKDTDGELNLTYDAPYRNFTYTITLTAKWNLNDAKVTYDVGEGSGTFTDDASYKLGNIITIPSGEPTPPAGTDVLEYVFRGWMDAKGDLHLPGERFAYSDEALISTHENPNEIKLTAAYQEIPIGTLAFLSQGGSLIDPIKSEEDTTVDLTPYVPTRSGYEFAGWYTEPEYTNRVDSIAIIVNQSKRVYAKWTAENHNLFFYFFNGGSLFETITKAYNTDVTAPADPTRTGYTFKGWDKTIPLLMPAQDMTFYGTWDINKWKVTYQLYDDVTNEVEQRYGETVVEPQKPTRDGYTFERWVDTNGVEKTFPFIMPDQNVILKAEWKQNQAAPTNLTVTDASSDVSNDGKIEGVNDTMEYSLDGGKTWIPVPAGKTEINGLNPCTVQIRYKATDDKNPSPATEVEVKVKAKLFKGNSITLRGDISLNFLIDPQAIGRTDFNNFGTAKVTFTWDEGNGEKYGTAYVDLKNAPLDSNTGYYKATCKVVAAHMAYEIFAELYLDSDEPVETAVCSVKEYAEELYDNAEVYAPAKPGQLRNLAKAMLNYGAQAQIVFKDDLADASVELANSYVGENDYESVTADDIAAKINDSASDMSKVASDLGAKYYGSSLVYLSECSLRVYFTPTTYPGTIPNSDKYINKNNSNYYYYVEVKDIPAPELDDQQEFDVGGYKFYMSALDYAKLVVGSNLSDDQKNLAKALFIYNQAANYYFD